MRRKSLIQQIWELFSPILLKTVVAIIVETIILLAYYMQYIDELMAVVDNQEAMIEKVTELATQALQYAVEISAVAALVTIPFLAYMKRRDTLKARAAGEVPMKRVSWLHYWKVIAISIPFSLGLNNIIILMDLPKYSEAYQEATQEFYTPSLPVQILCLGIVLPIMEELIFRGLIYRRMKRDMPSAMQAILMSGVFFGLYHGNLVQIIYATLAGFLLAYLYEKFGSLTAPILAHIFMNTVICILTDAKVFVWMFGEPMRMGIITVICAALASSVFILIRQMGFMEAGEETA